MQKSGGDGLLDLRGNRTTPDSPSASIRQFSLVGEATDQPPPEKQASGSLLDKPEMSRFPRKSSLLNGPTSPVPSSPILKKSQNSEKVFWGPIFGVLYGFGLALIGAQLAIGVMLGVILGLSGMSDVAVKTWVNTIHGQFIYVLLAELISFGLIALYVWERAKSLRPIGIDRFKAKYLLYIIVGLIVYFTVYLVTVTVAAACFPSLNLSQEQDIGFKNPSGLLQLVMVFVSLVILPPIAEETIFRGFIFAGLRRKLPFILSAIFTSLLFALGHLQFGSGAPLLWVAGIDTFVLSVVLCFIREKTGSIWPTIAIHALKNFIAFSFLYLLK